MSSDESFSDCSGGDNDDSDGDDWISEDGGGSVDQDGGGSVDQDGWISEESIEDSIQSSSDQEEADEDENSGHEEANEGGNSDHGEEEEDENSSDHGGAKDDEDNQDGEEDEESLDSASAGTEEDEELYHSAANGEDDEEIVILYESLSDNSEIEDATFHEGSEDLESCEWSTDYGEYYQRHGAEYAEYEDDPFHYEFPDETTEDEFEEPEDKVYSHADFFPSDKDSYINFEEISALARRQSARTDFAECCLMMVESAEVQGKTESVDGEDASVGDASVQSSEEEDTEFVCLSARAVWVSESRDVVCALEEVEYLGAGNFGQVFKMSGLRNGKRRLFAEKRMSITDPLAKTEQDMLESVSHRHIIRYIQSYIKADQMIVLMEFADRGTLTKMVEEASCDQSQEWLFEEHNIWRFISHMSSALNYLHVSNILHRDLKVTNELRMKFLSDTIFSA